MRPLIVTAFTSLDGVMEAPGGGDHRSAGWSFQTVEMDEAAYEIKGREQSEATALLLGRKTYEEFAPVWPSMEDVFAEYNAMPKYVVSSTLQETDPAWSATILRTLDDVAALKETEGGPISVHGSATLGANLADAGLVDRYHLVIFPILLGAGKRLWSEADKDVTKLHLVEHATYSNGVQMQVLDVVR